MAAVMHVHAQVNQCRWKWWYKNTFLDETPQEEITWGEIWGTWWPAHQFLIPHGHTPLLLSLSMDVHSIFFCKCNLCLETVNTTSELTYHRV
jgi:hypothetical protein